MCLQRLVGLDLIDYKTEAIKKLNTTVERWKVVVKVELPLSNCSVIHSVYQQGYEWKQGLNEAVISEDARLDEEARPGTVYGGIHVFVDKGQAEGEVMALTKRHSDENVTFVLMTVKCNTDDLIAAGFWGSNESEVYKQVFVEELP